MKVKYTVSRYKEIINLTECEIISIFKDTLTISGTMKKLGVNHNDPRIWRHIKKVLLSNDVSFSSKTHLKYTAADIQAAVEQSICITDVLKILGLTPHGGNASTVKTLIVFYDICTDHFNIGLAMKRGKKTWKPEEIFVVNSLVPRSNLAKYVKRYHIFEYCCVGCSSTGIWNNKPLTLTVDHINGINNDNRIENLRWLCPNCHSQTDTFGRKNVSSLLE